MKQIYLSSKDKNYLCENVNVFLTTDNEQIRFCCIENVADAIYQVIISNYSYLQEYFPDSFFVNLQQQYRISKNIAADLFQWIQNNNIDQESAIKSLQYNLTQFIQAYWVFDGYK